MRACLLALCLCACSAGGSHGLVNGRGATTGQPVGSSAPPLTGGTSSTPPPGGAAPPTMTLTPLGPRNISIKVGLPGAGEVCAVAVNHANPQVMYVGGSDWYGPTTCHGGVWNTQDGGTTWTQVSTGLTDTSVPALWINQNAPTTLVAATSHAGLFLSQDGAKTWKLTWGSGGCFDLVQQNTLLLAACAPGIYQSPDNGVTWTQRLATTSPARSVSMSQDGVLYVGLDNGQVLVQATANAPTQASNPIPAQNYTILHIAADPANSKNAYVVTGGPAPPNNFLSTTDGGTTWVAHTPVGVSAQVNAVAADSSVYMGADYYLYHSTDGGVTWTRLATPSGTAAGAWWDDRHITANFDGMAASVAVGSDQGLYTSTDTGVTWTARNGNRYDTSTYSVAISGQTIYACMQDYSSIASFDLGQTWVSYWSDPCTQPGEGGSAYANPYQTGQFYDYTGGGVLFSLDNLTTCTFATGIAANTWSGSNNAIDFDPVSHTKVYAAVGSTSSTPGGIYISNDSGQTWTPSAWKVTAPIALAVSPANGQVIYVGNQDGSISTTHDGGTTWGNAKTGSPSGARVRTLSVHPVNPNIVMVALDDSFQNGGGPFVSLDGGQTFTAANTGLDPTCGALQVAYDPAGTGRLVVAGYGCAYTSTDNGQTWTNLRGTTPTNQFNGVTWVAHAAYIPTSGGGLVKATF